MIKAISNTAFSMVQKHIANMTEDTMQNFLLKFEQFLPLLKDDSVSLDDFIMYLQAMVNNEWKKQEKIN